MSDTRPNTHIEDLTDRINPRKASNLLLWGVIAFVVVFFVWAAFAELERTVRGMGRVIPSSQLQVVSNPEGGVVDQILVRPGQNVRAGDRLMSLDPVQRGSEFGSGAATVAALDVKIARLEAEVAGREPVYPDTTDPSGIEQIRIEQALHVARIADLTSLLGAAEARLSQATRGVAEARATYEARITSRDSRAEEARMLRPLVERGIEPRLSLTQAESAAAVAASEASAAAAAISRAQASVAEARASAAQARQDWRARAATELAGAQAEREARRRTLPALAQQVERTVLRAPLSGRVNRVLVTTRGGTVQAGQPLVEIVPSEENLIVEARVRPQDIAFVRLDQDARVAITAYDRAVYGTLDGRVVAISPDAVAEERTGETYYLVRVRTDANALRDPGGRPLPIGPGMVAEVDMLGDTRTVLQYILTPITRLSESAFRER
ncbi:HlyD family type I secretion periplasmic adaptor subunit [Sphingosinicella sp. LHD-64]|uniref:HlyD family type I secretion periplasmic adaptor subunit n=1 Tax=Sphingosinicella sp. LHD-64 TaxID=3072139 RepID=UPI00280F8686|nr:HlyD family type I secretion periplasmic adaptor subunit [Sphingosinicella sp. LHD-64]MDQ8754820.1 HlyD family type I secretion periplasmic adaptor subunit [Sphingosinicella sp. LHD-64]